MERTDRELYKLDSLDNYELVDGDQDLRGETLVTPNGEEIGEVDDMLVNPESQRVEALRLDDDRVVDVDDVEIRDGKPVLLVAADRVPRPGPDFDRDNITSKHIPIIEEKLEVAKKPVVTGRIQVRTRTVEEPVSRNVDVRQEHIDVDRRKVDQPIDANADPALFKDRNIELTERGEKVVAGKEARVTEEVVVSKDTDSRTERVQDTVRHTEVDVDRDADNRRNR